MKTKICYLTYTDGKTPLPKGWERWFSTTYQLFYYRYIDNNRHKQIQWKSPKKFNKYNYSPTLETVIDFNLKDDLKKIYLIDTDEIVIDFNLKDDLKKIYLIDTDKDIQVILIYKGYDIKCTINRSDTKLEIKIVGKKGDCLEFLIYNYNEDKKYAYIGLISISDNECPLSEEIEKKGTFLLSMVDEICKQLEIDTLKLTDGSYIKCKKNQITVNLQFLSLMKYGFSWYERNGFSYKDNTDRDAVNKIREIRNKPISEIRDYFKDLSKELVKDIGQVERKAVIRNLENWKKSHPNFEEQLENKPSLKTRFNNVLNTKYDFKGLENKINIMLNIISEYEKANENSNLYEFLTYLWDNDCSKYVDVMSVLYPEQSTRNYIDESILPNFPLFPSMIKIFQKSEGLNCNKKSGAT
jgi:hypothetical protein